MKIAICFYGVLYGNYNRPYDVRHCWPNLHKMIVEPYKKEHEVEVFLSTYDVEEESLRDEIFDMIKPNHVIISKKENSTSRTTKFAIFELLKDKNFDFVIMTRTDLHFCNPIIEQNIDYNKFNFLFHERFHKHANLTCDNCYMWPHNLTDIVRDSFVNCEGSQPPDQHDTHKLYHSLTTRLSRENIHYISGEEEHLSDVNKYFTICKTGYGNERLNDIHPEVIDRYYRT